MVEIFTRYRFPGGNRGQRRNAEIVSTASHVSFVFHCCEYKCLPLWSSVYGLITIRSINGLITIKTKSYFFPNPLFDDCDAPHCSQLRGPQSEERFGPIASRVNVLEGNKMDRGRGGTPFYFILMFVDSIMAFDVTSRFEVAVKRRNDKCKKGNYCQKYYYVSL